MRLASRYLGFDLPSPLVVSSSPLSMHLSTARAMEDAGAAALVLYSLFEEDIRSPHPAGAPAIPWRELGLDDLVYVPDERHATHDPQGYLEHVRALREALDIPVIASLNGASLRGWSGWAIELEQAGAHAVELNIHLVPTDPWTTSQDIDQWHADIVRDVVDRTSCPIAVKLTPYLSAPVNTIQRLADAGARGVVLFNRLPMPAVDLDRLRLRPRLSLSRPEDLGNTLRWLTVVRGQVEIDLAASTGIHDHTGALQAIAAGADVVMMTSCLLRKGVDYLATMARELERWLDDHGYESLGALRGQAALTAEHDAEAVLRASYSRALRTLG